MKHKNEIADLKYLLLLDMYLDVINEGQLYYMINKYADVIGVIHTWARLG
jgi:hypothetical protein